MSGLVYVDTANTRARGGSNATHLVVDPETWVARCGKTVADAYRITEAEVVAEVTCKRCAR